MDTRRRDTILLVEDEASIAEPFGHALEREGFRTVLAATAADALRAAAEERPDLVLLDLGLPDGDGRDVCRELRRGSDVPIVMVTARGTETDRIVGLELGADDYVVKPFSVGEVVARVRAVLRRRGPRRRRRSSASTGSSSTSRPGACCSTGARSSCGARSSTSSPGSLTTRDAS